MPAAAIKQPTLADLRLWLGEEEAKRYGADRAAMEKAVFAQATGPDPEDWFPFMENAGDPAFLRMCAWLLSKTQGAKRRKILETGYEYAVVQHYFKAAIWLIGQGLDLHGPVSFHDTALHVASNFPRPPIVKVLLSKGCDPNAPNGDGLPPLFHMIINLGGWEEDEEEYAVSHRLALETAKLLVGAGAKLEAKIGRKKESVIAYATGPLKAWLESVELGKGAGKADDLPKLPRRKF